MRQARHGRAGILIGCAITALMILLLSLKPSPFETIEAKLYDYRFTLRGPVPPPDSVVIAAIDEKSLRELGRWPWDRDVTAALLRSISKAGAEIVVLDVMFFEPDAHDTSLASAIRDAGNIILPVAFDFQDAAAGTAVDTLHPWALVSVQDEAAFGRYPPIGAQGALVPVARLIEEAMGVGHVNMIPDEDGTLRWEPMIIEYRGSLFLSIDLEAAALFLGVPRERIIVEAARGIRLGTKGYIPTDRHGRSLIHYYGPLHCFRHISASDILRDRIPPGALEGKMVLVGATAVGIYDLRVTPFYAALPGVEKHANVIASILQNRHVRTVPAIINYLVLLSAGVLFTLVSARFKAVGASVAAMLFLFVIGIAGYFSFSVGMRWLNVTYPALTVVLVFVSTTAYRYAVEERYARKIRAMFSSYVTERVVNELVRNPEMARLGGARREVTVLFSDVRGFTPFSEAHDPERVVAILNEYLAEMTEVVLRWEGTLDKFIGDAILAFWGAPLPQDDHAVRAVRCALEMGERLERLHARWKSEGKPLLDIGIGINTGGVIVGNIGAEGKKMDYTVIGDHVNLGSRVEALTRKYDVRILITEHTVEKIRPAVENGTLSGVSVAGIERVVVKGKERPVTVYELTGLPQGHPSVITEIEGAGVTRLDEK